MKRSISAMVGKGSLGHNSRSFYAENVKQEKSVNNVVFRNENLKEVYAELFDNPLKEYNAKQTRKDRRIEDYYKHIQQGKQEKLFHEVIFQIGNETNMPVDSKEGELAKEVLCEFMRGFEARNPNLRVFSAHLHMDEATPHLHIDFVPFTTGSKRGLETRVSLRKALGDQGFEGGTRENTELNQWVNSEKEQLAQVMLEYGIEWEKLGTQREHLSVLDYKKQERQKEIESLEIRVEKLEEQQIAIKDIEKITVSAVPFSKKVALEKSDYEKLASGAKKYVVQEKSESKLKKLLASKNKEIAELKETIKALSERLSGFTSVIHKQLDAAKLQQENARLQKDNQQMQSFIDLQGLGERFRAFLLGKERNGKEQTTIRE